MRLCDELEAAWSKIQQKLSEGATPNYIYKTVDLEVSSGVLKYLSLLLYLTNLDSIIYRHFSTIWCLGTPV